MNRVVGIVATLALVMHFTLGCYAHSCHHPGCVSSQVVQEIEAGSTRCCHHGHRHHAHKQRPTTDAASPGFKAASTPCQYHCEHCSCTVTLNEKVQFPIENWAFAIVVYDDPARLGLIATDRATGQVSIVLPGQRVHALCERFLI